MRRQLYIALTTLLLLIGGGAMNSAWAVVTYKILTLPITTHKRENSQTAKLSSGMGALTVYRNEVRVEALKCTSTSTTVGLPDEFKSPLAHEYKYYKLPPTKIDGDQWQTLYGYSSTTYEIYNNDITSVTGQEVYSEGISTVDDGSTIYVTYEYNADNTILDLTGTKKYNVKMGSRFLAYNYGWGNRPTGYGVSDLESEGLDNLSSNDDVTLAKSKDGSSAKKFHFLFKFDNESTKGLSGVESNGTITDNNTANITTTANPDPYNIRISTAYSNDDTYWEKDKGIGGNVVKEYRGASIFWKRGSEKWAWLSSDVNIQWQTGGSNGNPVPHYVPGYFRGAEGNNHSEMNPIVNSFALLNHASGTGYSFVTTKMNSNRSSNVQPTSKSEYCYWICNDEKTNVTWQTVTSTTPDQITFYEVKTFTFHVKTSFGNDVTATKQWSSYNSEAEIQTSDVPESLKRKYCSFTGFYSDAALTQKVTKYSDLSGTDIYVAYTVSGMPFTALKDGDSYTDATWYELKDNAEQWLYKIQYNESGTNGGKFTRDLDVNSYNKHSEFAFIGDPYELHVINRYLSETNSANYYVGSSGTLNEALTASATVNEGYYKWEIVSDNTTGSFVLRQFNSYDDPRYWEWQSKNWSGETDPLVYYKSATTHRIYVNELPKYQYSYFVIDSNGRIAAKATVEQAILDKPELPSIIYSPFLKNETVTYYSGTYTDKSKDYNGLTTITEMPASNYSNIYVTYTLTDLGNKSVKLNDTQSFNVQLNGKYIYYKNEGGTESIQSADALENTDNFKWQLLGSDPYAMKIKNVGANKYVTNNSNNTDRQSLSFTETEPTDLSLCIAKGTSQSGVYEVMFATGNSFDASYTYFNIGRSETDGVKEYSNSTYASGYAQLRFVLYGTENAKDVTYHLIDHQNNELLTVVNRHVTGDTPQFPSEYWSPLVKTYHYYASMDDFGYNSTDLASPHYTKDGHSEISTINTETHENIYVTYETGDLVDLSANTMYLMEYEMGTPFYAENGLDGFDTKQTTAPFFPYCNGDNNFFVYGKDQYDLQQQGAASTRTRWAWYPESDYNDPYHVKIKSRQTSPYSGADIHAYFHTHKPVDYSSVITTLTWPSASGVAATEYMIFGSVEQYQLVTTYGIDLNNDGDRNDEGENVRQTLKSFEQYWKTFDTIKKNIFGLDTADDSEPTTVPETTTLEIPSTSEYYPYKDSKNLREYLTDKKGYHNYEQWAYAKRWNGYNPSGKKSKGWEKIEHWFQTVAVGEGYFNFIEMTIDPALILLDQHGWEIMRRPLPNSPDDPDKAEKYAAIRPFNSPMVDKYYFWTKTSKRSGCHQYYKLQQQVTVDGEPYTSTSLTDLPPFATAKNIKDSQGNVLDQYVTYVAKEEYAYSYNPNGKTGEPFMIQQGGHYVSTSDGTTITKNDATGGISAVIIAAGNVDNDKLWYLKPNATIDNEMGYETLIRDWENDYDGDTSTRSGFNSNGFDPYNIQISSVSQDKYFTTNADSVILSGGVMTGTYPTQKVDDITSEVKTVSLSAKATEYVDAEGHDHTTLQITNQTFMAVQDENGNMQLMPRFDSANRMTDFDGLSGPQENPADDKTGTQSTLLYRPYIYNYIIVDNQGRESLRYQSAGELTPLTPSHFKSPLATDFAYYMTLTSTGTGTYNLTTLADSVSSFAKLSMSTTGTSGNTVYVRYKYDESADHMNILNGKWLTMELNALDAKYDGGIKNVTKPETVDNDAKAWQWKFLKNNWITDNENYVAPDPYAVEIYNRSQKDVAIPTDTRFALLSHTSDGYALAKAGEGLLTYNFLNGASMTTDEAASIKTEAGFTSLSGTFIGTNSQVLLSNDVENTYTYKVITNAGVFAVQSTQSHSDAQSNNFVPTLPDDVQSPLLNIEDYTYYENATSSGSTFTVTTTTAITSLNGLYEDYLYVRYNAYDKDKSSYTVPNKRNETPTDQVIVHENSHDAALDISGTLPYNIIWYEDNMMYNNNGSIGDGGSKALTGADASYIWKFVGNDPYAIKIKNNNGNKYIYNSSGTSCSLDEKNSTTFMLLSKDGYEYGILQVTGGSNMLSGYGHELTATTPTKFIIFPLSTYSVIYHLVIQNINSCENIYYREEVSGTKTTIAINGSTKRDLTVETGYPIADKYLLDVSLGDKLEVPDYMYRPNCLYTFYVEGIYDYNSETDAHTRNETLDDKYQGLKVTHVLDDPDLIGRELKVNIVYAFDTGLGTNAGGDFVSSVDKYWYTFNALGDSDPYLAQYTSAWGLKCLEGRASRYTNDYLWTPVGDPYGFQMYNRYAYKNNGAADAVMTSMNLTANTNLGISDNDSYLSNSIYELLEAPTAGYFYVHPVANTANDLFVERDDSDNNELKLNTTGSEWTFGLSIDQLQPYFDRTGYVGGLTKTAYEADANKALVSAIKSGTMTYDQLVATQKLVYDDSNIQPYASGYYRLHSQPDIPSVTTPRYASGYLHEIEKTAGDGGTSIPMHFYSKKGVTTTFGALSTGFTSTAATRGQIPIPATENDPSTIFYFPNNDVVNGVPTSKMMTQELYAYESAMTSESGSATTYYIMDIGGATLLIHDGATPKDRKYLCFDQRTPSTIYDLQFKNDTPTDDAKWCMVPADTLGLTLELNSGGDSHYYTTLYVPFDVKLPNAAKDTAYVCTAWDSNVLYPKAIGDYNTGTYADNSQFIPAGTPVIIRSTTGTELTVRIPTNAPTASISNVFVGQYLEQLLDNGGGNEVFTFGLPFTSTLTKDGSYESNGQIAAPVPTQASTGVGFYINANLNKENGAERGDWVPRNNRYVLHNKIYYRASAGAAPTRSAEFIPVDFTGIKDLEGHGDEESAAKAVAGDGRVYNMRGQCVATGQEAADGSWMLRVPHGVYILNGKKILVK